MGTGSAPRTEVPKISLSMFVPSLPWHGEGLERGICEHRLPPLSSMSHGGGWEVRGGREGGRYPLLGLWGVRRAGDWRQSHWGKRGFLCALDRPPMRPLRASTTVAKA